MKNIYVNQIQERQIVDSTFLVREKTTAMAKNGKPYMTLKLMDRSGEVEGRIWDRVDQLSARFDKDTFIQVHGKASVYLGKMQLVIQDLNRIPEEAVDLADFLPVSQRSTAEMRQELDALLDSLTDPPVEALLRAFFDDPEFFALYSKAPAAKGMHHVYIGGLLEHSLAVSALACDLSSRYPQINRDLLIAGTLLHDVGKVAELSYQRSFDYTDEGKLLGHIVIGVQMIEDRVRTLPGFPKELATMIKHLLLSHHGQYEFGSPKRPKFLEAVVLNFIDDLDSKINGVLSHIEKEPNKEGNWTSYHRLYDRYFYKGSTSAEPVPPRLEADPRDSARRQTQLKERSPRGERQNYNKPLGATLAEQLKEKDFDLFSVVTDKGESS
ncbi:MAG: HD domain-containing protein [Deltaproteobacteria bacterium]|nr:HD domain-containing protein [Deltaproteobacteria bacterium]MCW8893588.1 HD domain-containing protein [Deltaproteobacteria bacterium]MCW9048821.1 HD domain-containing protein [Deltaproteobacteria bacterium]